MAGFGEIGKESQLKQKLPKLLKQDAYEMIV